MERYNFVNLDNGENATICVENGVMTVRTDLTAQEKRYKSLTDARYDLISSGFEEVKQDRKQTPLRIYIPTRKEDDSMNQTPEYAIEVRDINGKRLIREFDTREDFYDWTTCILDGLFSNTAEMEIMLITQRISIGDTSSNVILYSSLGGVETIDLDWEDLARYLA